MKNKFCRFILWRDLNVMGNFLQIRKDIQEKLGRELQDKDLVFLEWLHGRYIEEEQSKS